MPSRTRTTKVLKENIDAVKKTKQKSNGKATKPPRKALADKTNSLSDDNASIDIPIKTSKKVLKSYASESNERDNVRPRRKRRLPPRYIENHVLKNLSNSKDSPVKQTHLISKADTPTKKSEKLLPIEVLPKNMKNISKTVKPSIKMTNNALVPAKTNNSQQKKSDKPAKKAEPTNKIASKDEIVTAATRPRRNCRLQSAIQKPTSPESSLNVSSPFKTPPKDLEISLVGNRPKRICRLPSRFEDHSVSPNKFIPVRPCHASTPILQKKTVPVTKNVKETKETNAITNTHGNYKSANKPISKHTQKSRLRADAKTSSSSSLDKSSPDSNNNGKNKIVRAKRQNLKTKQANQEANPFAKRLLDNSLSFRILEDIKQSIQKGDDVYEFKIDPNEEPPPQKKKRKRTVNKKPAKPKMTVLKSLYGENVAKALATLKSKIKPPQTKPVQNNVEPTENIVKPTTAVENVQNSQAIAKPQTTSENIPPCNNYSAVIGPAIPLNKSAVTSIHESNYDSVCIEDIAADFEPSMHQDNINYSPVHPPTPEASEIVESLNNPVVKDPLNLQEDLSFFDEQPVASSSMNVSVRHPLASPWRVEFGSLPMKWNSDTYVKRNMTPAVESSFINSEEMSKKKHVYTNIVPVEPLPEIFEKNTPNLKQPSIISFMREVAEKSANKKKRRHSPSPAKANSIFVDITDTPMQFDYNTPKKAKKTAEKSTPVHVLSNSNEQANEKENSNQNNKSVSPDNAQTKDKDCTYFGFDDSENIDQENISPVKIIPNTRTRGLRSRAVLQQLNAQAGPTRAAMPVAAKPKLNSSDVAEQLYDQLKSAEDAPQFPEKETAKESADNTATNVDDPSSHDNENDDSQSVHLFEDIEVVHHLKAHRKSYGKAKKVTFPQPADSDSDSQQTDRPVIAEPDQSSDDDLTDLTFQMPNVKPKKTMKKKKPKKQFTKKEEKEAEEWAAGFNSMCDDIDEFPLVVE